MFTSYIPPKFFSSVIVISFIPFFLLLPTLTLAHGGNTDSFGGHFNSKTGIYHFHASAVVSKTFDGLVSLFSFEENSEPKKRDPAQRRRFYAANPCPVTGKTSGPCPGYHVDHIVPLACGGSDSPSNMQWLPAYQNLSKGSQGCSYDD